MAKAWPRRRRYWRPNPDFAAGADGYKKVRYASWLPSLAVCSFAPFSSSYPFAPFVEAVFNR
jgi:hypothetical protein